MLPAWLLEEHVNWCARVHTPQGSHFILESLPFELISQKHFYIRTPREKGPYKITAGDIIFIVGRLLPEAMLDSNSPMVHSLTTKDLVGISFHERYHDKFLF